MNNSSASRFTKSYDACAVIEGFNGEDNTDEDVIEAFQYLIDAGLVWSLQGYYGRTAHQLIENGLCRPPLQ